MVVMGSVERWTTAAVGRRYVSGLIRRGVCARAAVLPSSRKAKSATGLDPEARTAAGMALISGPCEGPSRRPHRTREGRGLTKRSHGLG